MSTVTAKPRSKVRDEPRATYVTASDTHLSVRLADGREVSVPLAWYPRLAAGTSAERNRWELIGKGVGIHWPDLDEDLSVEGILAGKKSGESRKSFNRWLKAYENGEDVKTSLILPLPEWAKK